MPLPDGMTYATIMRIAFPNIPFKGNGLTYNSLVATSNTPIPTEQELLAAVPIVTAELDRRRAIDNVRTWYQNTLKSGFVSSALGTPHTYSTTTEAKIDLIGLVLAIQCGATGPFPYNTKDAGPQLHTKDQIMQVFFDGLKFITDTYTTYTKKLGAI